MKKVESRFKGLMLVSAVMAVIDICIGALLALYLKFTTNISAVIIGTVILLHGIFYLIRYIYDGLGKKVFAINLINAVICIILGVFTLFFDFTDSFGLGIVYAIYLISNACEKGYFGYKLNVANDASYPIVCFIAALSVVMAVLVGFNPFKASMLSTKLVGIFMLCTGVFEGMICKLFFDKTKTILGMFK